MLEKGILNFQAVLEYIVVPVDLLSAFRITVKADIFGVFLIISVISVQNRHT